MTDITIREFQDDDLPGLVQHWKDSVDGWPPGEFTGWEFTPEGVHYALFRQKRIATWVAHAEDKIVGFMNFDVHYDEPDACYIPLLNVQPDYHGKGAGRDLIRQGVNRALDLGAKRLDLHTWAANMKAVPLYKKTGFLWRPRTEVHMYNFLPTVLRNQLVIRFLDGEDWYPHLDQEITMEENDEVLDGCYVHKYLFQRNGHTLEVRVDPSTSGITAIISDDIDLRCELRGDRHIAGMGYPIKWRFSNKKNTAVKIALNCKGADGVGYDFVGEFPLEGERAVESKARVGHDITPLKHDWWGIPVKCQVSLDEHSFEMAPGLRALQPFEMDIFPGPLYLGVGEKKEFTFNLKSNFPFDITFAPQVKVVGDIDVQLTGEPGKIAIPAEGSIGINAAIKATGASGNASIDIGGRVYFDDEIFDIKPVRVNAVVSGSLKPVWIRTHIPDISFIGGGIFNVRLNATGGLIQFTEPLRSRVLLTMPRHSIGEPYSNEMESIDHEIDVMGSPRGCEVVMSGKSREFPGMSLVTHMIIPEDNRAILWQEIINSSDQDFSGKVKMDFSKPDVDEIIIPLHQGIIQGPPTLWLSGDRSLPTDASAYAENWFAFRNSGSLTGMVHPSYDAVAFFPWYKVPCYEWDVDMLPPGGRLSLPEVAVIFGASSIDEIRCAASDGYPKSEGSVPRGWTHVRSPVFNRVEAPFPLEIHIARENPFKVRGSASVSGGERIIGVNDDWRIGNPLKFEIPTDDISSGIHPVEYEYEFLGRKVSGQMPLMQSNGGTDVDITIDDEEGYRTFSVNNGVQEFKVSPKFSGALRWWSLNSDSSVNLLRTDFPEATGFTWIRPWYGGVSMYCWGTAFRFFQADFEAAPDEVEFYGHTWKGVRVDIKLPRAYSSIRFQSYFLTLPGMPVILNLVRLREMKGNHRRLTIEGLVHPAPGPDVYSLVGAGDGAVEIGFSETGADHMADVWTATTSRETGRTIGVIIPDAKLYIWEIGKEGHIPTWSKTFETNPVTDVALTSFYMATSNPDDVRLIAGELKYWVG